MRHSPSFSKGISVLKQTPDGSFGKMSGWLPASKRTENQIGARLYKTMPVRLMTFTEGGNTLKGGKLCQLFWSYGAEDETSVIWLYLPGCKHTPYWVDRSLGSLGRWNSRRWCCGSTCHSRSGWASGRHNRSGILKSERWGIESRDQWGDDWKARRVYGGLVQEKEQAGRGYKGTRGLMELRKEPFCPVIKVEIMPPHFTLVRYGWNNIKRK